MKKISLLAFTILLLFGCQPGENTSGAASAPASANSASGDLIGFNLTDLGGGLQKAERKDPSGKLLEEGYLFNGKRTGSWISYHPNDIEHRLQSITSYVNGVRNGIALDFDQRLQITSQSYYQNELAHGPAFKFAAYGRFLEIAAFENGKQEGLYQSYTKEGTLTQEANYKAGELNGKLKYFNPDGEVTMEYEYRNGKKVSGGIVDK